MTSASAGLRVPSVIVVSLWRAWLRHRCLLDQCRYSATASDFDRLPPATTWPTVAPDLQERQGRGAKSASDDRRPAVAVRAVRRRAGPAPARVVRCTRAT